MFCACVISSTNTSENSTHKSFNSFGHSGFGHVGVCGSGSVSQDLKRLGVVVNSVVVAEFVPQIQENGQPGCSICSFF